MLETIIVILFVLWLLGLLTSYKFHTSPQGPRRRRKGTNQPVS
jgi:hypothetical protein